MSTTKRGFSVKYAVYGCLGMFLASLVFAAVMTERIFLLVALFSPVALLYGFEGRHQNVSACPRCHPQG